MIRFPDKDHLRFFAGVISQSGRLAPFLPVLTERWSEKTEAIIRIGSFLYDEPPKTHSFISKHVCLGKKRS